MPNTNMATFGTRLYTKLSALWVGPFKHKADTGDLGDRDMIRAVIKGSMNQSTHLMEFHDYSGNVLAYVDAAGNFAGGGLTGLATPSSGQVALGQAAGGPAFETMSGDATISAAGALSLNQRLIQYASVSITAANITDTGAGHLGHAAGVPLVAAPGSGYFIELISAVLSYTFGTAAFTGGGNITVNYTGGSAVTGLVSFANSVGAGASNITQFVPLAAAAGYSLPSNTGLSLVAASAPTQPGTAAGTAKVFLAYRVHTL